jgi:CHAT domain-containing protein
MVPVPQLLPALIRGRELREETTPSLLTLGDPDYENSPANEVDKSSTPDSSDSIRLRARGTRRFGPLVETGSEVAFIQQTYRENFPIGASPVQRLSQRSATEENFRQFAPQVSHLHLATHGFFADEEIQSAENNPIQASELPISSRSWSGLPTGLLSGLALAGANASSTLVSTADGILSADEIATLPLGNVDLAVLSACETGLGRSAGGEGILGLQRAFQVSGVASTVASLWSVNDLETRLLMERFYQNLWNQKRSRVDALRQAQLDMMRIGPNASSRQRAAEIDLANANIEEQPQLEWSGDDSKLPPFYWAAFSLSGDWE